MKIRSYQLFSSIRLVYVVLALSVVLLASLECKKKSEPTGKLVVHYLDVGQGDSELLQLPDGENILIDSGEHGAPTVKLLKQYGIRTLDLVIATHPHSDHVGEMKNVLTQFTVNEFWDSGLPSHTATYDKMLDEIEQQKIKLVDATAGMTKTFGQVLIEVVHPDNGPPMDSNPNDASVVVRVTFGDKRFLFPGDAELPSWERMFKEHRDQVQANVLKAAHHGSSNGTNSGVLLNVKPEYYVICCGVGNDYHHPHPSVMNLLKKAGEMNLNTKLYRTDLQGTITLTCDGKSILAETEKIGDESRLYMSGDEIVASFGIAVKSESYDSNAGSIEKKHRKRR